MELKDKVVLITGSSEGIGAETAKLFAQEGSNLVITYLKNKEKAKEVFEECNKFREAMLIKLDIRDEKSIKKCVESVIDNFGAIDVLVNNAGVAIWKNFVEQSFEEIDSQIDINLKGLIKMTKVVLPYMQAQEESLIINISSGAGKTGFSELTTYCGTKFGVRGFTQALSTELPKKIKIYSVNPGMTSTKMTNYTGVETKKVAKIILNSGKEFYKKSSGDDVDVWKYL